MNDRYIFDLDNTLIMTDELNNVSYNYALAQLGLQPITVCTRITRDVVFNNYANLTELEKNQIVKWKQDYFMENIYFTYPNTSLINLLQSKKAVHCVLWTSADKNRVRSLLTYYRLENHFVKIIYSGKQNVNEDIAKICGIFNCTSKQLFFFEDDVTIVDKLKLLGQRVFVVDSPRLVELR